MEGFEDMITVERMIQGRHMDYLRQRRLGRPIGSGAVESLCAQLQNPFKLRIRHPGIDLDGGKAALHRFRRGEACGFTHA